MTIMPWTGPGPNPERPWESQPFGLLRPNIPRGLFGASSRVPAPMRLGSGPRFADGSDAPIAEPSAPPLTSAPPPPSDWKNIVGPDLLGQMPRMNENGNAVPAVAPQALPPSPPMRGGMIVSGPKYPVPLGMIGNAASLPMSEKIANGATLPMDANGKGKKGFDWRMLAGIVGDGLLGAVGRDPIYGPNMWKLRQQQAEHQNRMAQQAQEWQYRNNQPDYATVGNRRFSYNPATGEAQTLYVAPSEAQDYAAALGAEPGTPEYETLMADYVLRHSGPTATANAMQEEDNRQTNRIGLEGVRQQNRIGIEGVRQGNRMSLRRSPTYRDTHPRPSTARSGGSGGGKGGIREGQTATNPQTGAKVVYRGGKWVPAR